ncbi:MAG TPA: hypothetical protein VEQ58_15515 [Polyangiaceae bacterium]|nr:hypothetical protein [Polyangiaceae bacterium]
MTLSSTPRLLKGALIGLDPLNPLASVVVFQYNPDTMTRRLEPRAVGGDGDRSEAMRLTGPPKETISLTVEVDATDQLEKQNPIAVASGVYPALSALEMMVYPKSALVIANTILAAIGTIELLPAEAPFTLFVWGPQRVVPVRVASISITEEAYDPLLNPIRAKVELSLTVLSYNDLTLTNPGSFVFMAHQVLKETMASLNIASSAQNIAQGLKL